MMMNGANNVTVSNDNCITFDFTVTNPTGQPIRLHLHQRTSLTDPSPPVSSTFLLTPPSIVNVSQLVPPPTISVAPPLRPAWLKEKRASSPPPAFQESSIKFFTPPKPKHCPWKRTKRMIYPEVDVSTTGVASVSNTYAYSEQPHKKYASLPPPTVALPREEYRQPETEDVDLDAIELDANLEEMKKRCKMWDEAERNGKWLKPKFRPDTPPPKEQYWYWESTDDEEEVVEVKEV